MPSTHARTHARQWDGACRVRAYRLVRPAVVRVAAAAAAGDSKRRAQARRRAQRPAVGSSATYKRRRRHGARSLRDMWTDGMVDGGARMATPRGIGTEGSGDPFASAARGRVRRGHRWKPPSLRGHTDRQVEHGPAICTIYLSAALTKPEREPCRATPECDTIDRYISPTLSEAL